MSANDPVLNSGSMAEVLLERAAQTPNALAFGFLIDGEDEGPRVTYAGLDREARAVAAVLQDVAEPGDRALLLYAPGLAFIAAFFGCQYAGVVPVPAYPPRLDRLAQGWEALAGIAADCAPRVVLCDRIVAPFVPTGGAVPALQSVAVVVTDALDPATAGRWRAPRFDPDALALLQYTSGSTAAPKGVMVTHRNLMHNQVMIRAAFEHSGLGIGISWLPPYHDMGLIGGLVQTVFHGGTVMLLSPVAFLQNPLRWLRAVSRYRADTSGGPAFAYDLCVRHSTPEQRGALDLRTWSVAAVGAEPIGADTLRQFAEAFAPAGFRSEAFFPCYGLSEATLLVTGGPKGRSPVVRNLRGEDLELGRAVPARSGDPAARAVVGCGRPWLDQQVRVVDPDTRAVLADGLVGEIWVRGPSVARGYWGQPDLTEQTFRATPEGTAGGPYLRTGDLGFSDGGELFVTGRLKDLIIIRGRNYYPQDIEETVQSVHPGLRTGCGVVFEAVRGGRPGLVVLQEVGRRCRDLSPHRLEADVRRAVAERHELQVHEVVLVEPGGIVKTSSGKVRRQACRVAYDRGELRRWGGDER